MNRSQYLGGSDIAAIVGLSPWSTPLKLYMKKIGSYEDDLSEEKQKIFKRGHRLEKYVLEMLEEDHKIKVIARNKRYSDPKHDFLSCEIDAEGVINDEHINIEIKTSSGFCSSGWENGVPLHYVLQAQYGLMITGRNKTIFGVLIGIDDFRTYTISRDEKVCEFIKKKAIDFWLNNVKALVPPEATTSLDIEMFYGVQKKQSIDCGFEMLSIVEEIEELKEQKSQIENLIEERREKVKMFLGDCEILTHKGQEIASWRRNEVSRLDSKKLQKDHPDLYAKYCKTKTECRFITDKIKKLRK